MTKSKVVGEVIADLQSREQKGFKKYGVTLDRKDLTKQQWMQHHYEELLDAACYVKKQILFETDIRQLNSEQLIALKESYYRKIKDIDNEFRKRG